MSFLDSFDSFFQNVETPSSVNNTPRRGDATDVVCHLSSEGDFAYFTQPLQFRIPTTVDVSPVVSPRSGTTRPAPTYWTVRTISTRTDKKDCACIGEMDTTSVFAFRDSEGNKGRMEDRASNEAEETKEDGKVDPISSRNSPSPNPLLSTNKSTASREYRDGKFAEDHALVPYDEEVTIFTNFGLGGRFLSNWKKGQKVCWKSASDTLIGGNRRTWVVRKAPDEKQATVTTEESMLRRKDNFVRCGDVVYLESFDHPGYFVKPSSKGVNILALGREGSELQVVAPSLRFAIKLGERTSMYKAAAVSARNAKSQGQERRKRLLQSIMEAKEAQQLRKCINHIVPEEIIGLVLSFFTGCNLPVHVVPSGLYPHEVQEYMDKLPVSARKENVKFLKRAREVCKQWDTAASMFIKGIRAYEMMLGGGTSAPKKYLQRRIGKFPSLTSINLRNMDALTSPDFLRLSFPQTLRCLNLGGCYRLDDDVSSSIAVLESLVHLNIATTRITDYGIEVIAGGLKHLVTVNLFGMKLITMRAARVIAETQVNLKSLNLRAAGEPLFLSEKGKLVKRLCKREDCEVLTGRKCDDGVY